MTTIPLELVGAIDLAFEVGSFCYWNDEPCPYTLPQDVAEWYRGYLAASENNNPTNKLRSTPI